MTLALSLSDRAALIARWNRPRLRLDVNCFLLRGPGGAASPEGAGVTLVDAGTSPACLYNRSAMGLLPAEAKNSSGIPIHANARPQSLEPPCATATTGTGFCLRSRARSVLVVITATAPSVS